MSPHIDHVPTAADAETDAFDEDVISEASHLGASLFWAFAVLALLLLALATRGGKRDLGWMQEPWAWPLIVLVVALAVTIGIVLAFRVGPGIWFPLPPIIGLFPDRVGNALGDWL